MRAERMRNMLFVCLSLWMTVTHAQSPVKKKFYQTTTFKTLAAPTLLTGYGLLCMRSHGLPSSYAVHDWRDRHFPTFHNNTDDYLVLLPAGTMYALDASGVKPKHDVLNQTILLAKTSVITLALVYGLKYTTQVPRPDHSADNSFPSGHTAFAFAYATVLHEEFKDQSAWISIAGYTMASATGAMRILNNRHWYSDVLVGAGAGILSAKLVYLTHQGKFSWKKKEKSAFFPIIGKQQYGILWQKRF